MLGGTHGGTAQLEPEGVSEREDIIIHNNVKAFHKSINGNVLILCGASMEKLRYLNEGGASWNPSIVGCGICSEKDGGRR